MAQVDIFMAVLPSAKFVMLQVPLTLVELAVAEVLE